MKNSTSESRVAKEDSNYNATTIDTMQRNSTRKFSGEVVSGRSGSATQQQLNIKNQITLETLAANFVSSHVRAYCNDIATKFLELPEIQLVTPDSGKDVHSPITDIILPKLKPSADTGFAAVVMADVSGYSKLSSKLAEIGAQGAELLGKAMKGYLDQIIDIILQHGGDIVKFAGDAVIIYWKLPKAAPTFSEDDEEEEDTGGRSNADNELLKGDIVYKASLCCLELLRKLGTYNIEIPECEIKVLKIHLGIGAGLIYDVHVGHIDRWEHFIAGDGVNQLATVLDLAKSGELALSHSALKYLSMVIDIASVTIGNYDKRCIILTGLENAKRKDGTLSNITRLNKIEKAPPKLGGDFIKLQKIQQITDELIKQFINQSALFKLQMDLNQSRVFRMEAGVEELMKLNELRQVTTVFIKIGSLVVPDPKLMLETAQEVVSIVESTCRKFEGSMRQFHVDDKGAVVLIFFGLPPLAHTNDATYAIKAAIEIKERFEKQFDNFSIGLTTGAVSIGAVGNPQRTEYALMGDSINMAARLMCQPDAKKNVLCDVTSFKMSENEFTFEDRGEVVVKGKDKPIAIYRPQKVKTSGKKKGASEAVHVVGRKTERNEIIKVLTAHSKGASDKLIVFEAEGGQGLTTLFEFCKNEALQYDNQVIFAVGSELDRRTQFYTLRQIFLDILYTFNGKCQNTEDSNSLLQNWKASRVLKKVESNDGNDSSSNIAIDEMKILSVSTMPRKSSHTRFMSPKNLKVGAASTEVLNSVSPTLSSPYAGGYFDKSRHRQSGLIYKTNDSLEEKIAEMFISMREHTDNIPIMNALFPNQFAENETTSMIKGKLRVKELSKIICRIINHMSIKTPIVLQISEGQWVDLASWGLLFDIQLTCPDLLLMIFSKPDTHYESEETGSVYSLIKRLPHARVLVLEGLSIEETSDLVLYLWDKNASEGLTKVDRVLLEQIHKKTNGVPLIIESLVLILKESGACGAKETGALFLSKKDFDFNQNIIMGDSLTNLIVAQLDRIDRGFQLFLKVASVLGQRFRLADVIFFLSDTPGILEKLGYDQDSPDLTPIKALDKYSYLEHIEEDTDFILAFKSDLVRRCIYSTMVVSQRQQLHLYVASYFETMLNNSNKSRLLVQIHEHYSQTNYKNISKKLMYLAAVAHYYYEENMMFEAIKHYNILINLEDESKRTSELYFGEVVYDDHIRAIWHLELGDAYYSKSEFKLCEENMRKALTISGYTFPMKDSMISLLNWKSFFPKLFSYNRSMSKEQQDKNKAILIEISGNPGGGDVKHTISSIGNESLNRNESKESKEMKTRRAASGSLPTSSALGNHQNIDLEQQAINESPEYQRKSTIRKALMVLAHVLFREGRYVAHNYAVDMALKFSAEFPPDSFYGRLSSMKAHSTWLNKRDVSGTLSQTLLALRLDEKDNVANTIRIVEHTALTLFWMGQWNACIKFTNSLQHLGAISTNAGHCVDALRLKSFMSFMFGSRLESLTTAKELFTISTSLDDWEGKITSAQIMLVNMLLSSASKPEIVENKILLKKLWGQSPALLKSDNYMALIQTTVTAAAELRTEPTAFKLIEYLHDVDFTIERLVVRGTSKVIVVSNISLGNTRVWVSVLGIMIFCHTIMVLFQSGKPLTNEEKTQIIKVAKKSVRYLRESYEMRFFFLARCLKYQLRAVIGLFDQDFPFKSVKAWEMSISLCGSNANLMSGILHIWLSKYGQPSESKKHLKDAEKLLKAMGATYELEKRTV